MLEKFNEEINIAREKVATKKRLDGELNRLNERKSLLENNVRSLDKIRIKEDKDVAKLEKVSLSAILLSMFGKKEERLDKEKREAYAATLKYNEANDELTRLVDEIILVEKKYDKVRYAESDYKKAVDNKINL